MAKTLAYKLKVIYMQKLTELRIRNLSTFVFAKVEADEFTVHIKRNTLM